MSERRKPFRFFCKTLAQRISDEEIKLKTVGRAVAEEIIIYKNNEMKHIGGLADAKYRVLFEEIHNTLGDIWGDRHVSMSGANQASELRKSFSKGVNPDRALACYYWFHVAVADRGYADRIDAQVFKDKGDRPFKDELPRLWDESPKSHSNAPISGTNALPFLATHTSWAFADENIGEYIDHFAVEDFREFKSARKNGVWMVTAGPGSGKTTILSLIAHDLRSRNERVIPFFFRAVLESSGENSIRFFSRSLATQMSAVLGVDAKEIEDIFTAPDWRLDALFEFFRSRCYVNSEWPLVLLIDALDEISLQDQLSAQPNNPLHLPSALPEGLFIVTSLRIVVEERQDALEPTTPYFDRRIALDSPEFLERQKSQVRRFVRDMLLRDGSASLFHDASVEDRSEFVAAICEKAGYNFLILRCFLNERELWEENLTLDDLDIVLSSDLEGFFSGYLSRMLKRYPNGEASDAIYCLGRAQEISRTIFLMALGSAVDRQKSTIAQTIMHDWLAQGLISKHDRDDAVWLSPYHYSFRDFLLKYSLASTDLHRNERLAQHLTANWNFDGCFSALGPPDRQRQLMTWAKFTLNFALAAADVRTVRHILLTEDFWKRLALEENGVPEVFVAINQVSGESAPLMRDVFGEVARMLLLWVEERRIIKRDGTAYSMADFKQFARDHGAGGPKTETASMYRALREVSK